MLLILGGIEPNPGMKNAAPTTNKEKDLNQLVSEADSTIGQDICTRVLNIIAARHPKEAKEVTEMVFNMDASEVESLLKKPKYFEELVDDAVSLIKRCLAESDPLSKIETEMKVIPIARPKRAPRDPRKIKPTAHEEDVSFLRTREIANSTVRGDFLTGFVKSICTDWNPFLKVVECASHEGGEGHTWTRDYDNVIESPFPELGKAYSTVKRWRPKPENATSSDSEEDTTNKKMTCRKSASKKPRDEQDSPPEASPRCKVKPDETEAPDSPILCPICGEKVSLGKLCKCSSGAKVLQVGQVKCTSESVGSFDTPNTSPTHEGVNVNADRSGIGAVCPDCKSVRAVGATCNFCNHLSQGSFVIPSIRSAPAPTLAPAQAIAPAIAPAQAVGKAPSKMNKQALDWRLRNLLEARIYTNRKLNATEVRSFADQTGAALGGYSNSSIEERSEHQLRWLSVPRIAIPVIRNRRKVELAARHPGGPKAMPMSFRVERAIALAREGHLSKAAAVLARDDPAPPPVEETHKKLIDLHPLGPPVAPHTSDGVDVWTSVDKALLLNVINRGCRGSGPGPSGWTEELLQAAMTNSTVAAELPLMVRDILNNQIEEIVAVHFRASRLVAVGKPDSGVRPIAVGEAIIRSAATIALSAEINSISNDLQPIQFALCKGGAEEVIHRIRLGTQNEGQSVVSVDFSNAFNTVSRTLIANEVSKYPKMVPLFDLLYATPSDLYWRNEVITSSQGTRQGDVLGPALFSLAINPVLLKVRRAFPSVRVLAYMDDVTLMSLDIPSLKKAFALLIKEAAAIGLVLNRTKTIAYGPTSAGVASELGIKDAPLGFKCLGAWISHDARSIEDFLSAAVVRHIPFFKLISKLEPEIAFAILRFCGWPRLIYLCRTMDNMGQHAEDFDTLTTDTFLEIARIGSALDAFQMAMVHLPLKSGGLGLRAYATLAPQCYAASFNPTSDSEAARTKVIDMKLQEFVDSDSRWKEHRQATARRHACGWLQQPSSLFAFKGLDFTRALQLRIRYAGEWPQQKTMEVCQCGFLSKSPQDSETHLVGCSVHAGLGPSTRHNAVRDAVSTYLREHGATTMKEPQLDRQTRADLHVIIPDLGVDEVVDFVITNETSHSKPTMRSAVARKNKKYDGKNVLIAEATVLGGLGNGFCRFIKAVSQGAGQRHELQEIVLKTIQSLNGKILMRRNPRPLASSLVEISDSSSEEEPEEKPREKYVFHPSPAKRHQELSEEKNTASTPSNSYVTKDANNANLSRTLISKTIECPSAASYVSHPQPSALAEVVNFSSPPLSFPLPFLNA